MNHITINSDKRGMTLGEIAKLTGKTKRTIRNWLESASNGVIFTTKMKEVKSISPLGETISPLHEIVSSLKSKVLKAQDSNSGQDFTIDEVIIILQAGSCDTLARLLYDNYRHNEKDSFALIVSENDTKKELMLMSSVFAPMIKETLAGIFKPFVEDAKTGFEDFYKFRNETQLTLGRISQAHYELQMLAKDKEMQDFRLRRQGTREKINTIIKDYCEYTGIEQRIEYNIIYNRILGITGIRFLRDGNSSILESIEKYDIENNTNYMLITLKVAEEKCQIPILKEKDKRISELEEENEILKNSVRSQRLPRVLREP